MTLADILQSSATRIKSHAEAGQYVGGESNLQTLRRAGFCRPWREARGSVQWDVKDLDAAIDRVRIEGWPSGAGTGREKR